MMARARNGLIDLSSTPYYHVISRCVRRAFLCGEDKLTGKNFDHRRQWLVDRVKLLSGIYSIDITAYAIMSNHYHLVLRVNKEQAQNWSMDEVIGRWYRLYHGNALVDLYRNGQIDDEVRLKRVQEYAQEWRERLFDISWFMRNLNETIAREANKEDNCTGRYWEGRYKSQALLDETALLSCMMYVDLNPIRANMCEDLEHSDFTSIQERIEHYRQTDKDNINVDCALKMQKQPAALLPFGLTQDSNVITFPLSDYLALADWSGRAIHPKKSGYIDAKVPKIIETLGLSDEEWLENIRNFRRHYGNFAGSE
jgi:REP element-mobilizing transposase RayT